MNSYGSIAIAEKIRRTVERRVVEIKYVRISIPTLQVANNFKDKVNILMLFIRNLNI